MPVSYTHLDVYKRQLQIPSRSLRLYLLVTTALTLCTLFPFGAEHYVTACLLTGALMTAASIPVSYTHLDVYKRQMWQSVPTLYQSHTA